jgi:hypothetical protein
MRFNLIFIILKTLMICNEDLLNKYFIDISGNFELNWFSPCKYLLSCFERIYNIDQWWLITEIGNKLVVRLRIALILRIIFVLPIEYVLNLVLNLKTLNLYLNIIFW